LAQHTPQAGRADHQAVRARRRQPGVRGHALRREHSRRRGLHSRGV